MKKLFVFAVMFALSLSSAFAWEVNGKAFGLEKYQDAKFRLNPSSLDETDIVTIPTAGLGFGVGPNSTPSYGYSGGYDIVLGTASPSDNTATAKFSPLFGVGASLYFDMGPWINSRGSSPILADGGFNVIGPEIEGLVPSAQMVWNFDTGEKIQTLNLTAALDLFSGATIQKVAKL